MIRVLLCDAVAVVALMALVTLVARHTGRWAVADVAWGPGFLLIAVVSALVGDGGVTRRILFVVLVGVWALRLAGHIARRARGHEEDPRYQALRQRGGLVRTVLVPQGLAMWFVSLPIQVTAPDATPAGPLGWAGAAVWLVGFGFEAVGDAQLAAYRRDPDRCPVLDRGLWRYTRHPNYFGDACCWWGVWLVAAGAGRTGVLTVLSPVAMTYVLVFGTGARLLERTMMRRPGYAAYVDRTSMFVPLPPRRDR